MKDVLPHFLSPARTAASAKHRSNALQERMRMYTERVTKDRDRVRSTDEVSIDGGGVQGEVPPAGKAWATCIRDG